MVNTQVKDNIHQLKNKYQEFTDDEIKLMKSQDKNYIRLHQQMERKVGVFVFFSFLVNQTLI
jgi:hypothetical protein